MPHITPEEIEHIQAQLDVIKRSLSDLCFNEQIHLDHPAIRAHSEIKSEVTKLENQIAEGFVWERLTTYQLTDDELRVILEIRSVPGSTEVLYKPYYGNGVIAQKLVDKGLVQTRISGYHGDRKYYGLSQNGYALIETREFREYVATHFRHQYIVRHNKKMHGIAPDGLTYCGERFNFRWGIRSISNLNITCESCKQAIVEANTHHISIV